MKLTPAAETLLLILAANGGVMDKDDAEQEFYRVMSLPSLEEFLEWRRRALMLAHQHARRVLHGEEIDKEDSL